MLWDVFISHASEDKVTIARPLKQLLEDRGLRVWLDEAQITLGDSLRMKIDEGLSLSRFGIVILSPSFFAKQWPQRELNGLLAKEAIDDKVILPIWHDVKQRDVAKYSPILADRVAVSTNEGLETVVEKIYTVAGQYLDTTLQTVAGRYVKDFDFPMNLVTRAVEVIESLANEQTWKHLEITRERYPQCYWMGTDNPVLVDILYDLFAPLVQFHHVEYSMKRTKSILRPKSCFQYSLLYAALRSISEEEYLANMSPTIAYTPRVPDWRIKRQTNPQRYWWQGIERKRLEKLSSYMLKPKLGSHIDCELVDIREFRVIYKQVYSHGDLKTEQNIGLPANALYGFTPRERPVFWRVLITLARIYQAVLGNTEFDPETRTALDISKVFKPYDRNSFPYNISSCGRGFFEAHDVTMEATNQYFQLFILPKLRLDLLGTWKNTTE